MAKNTISSILKEAASKKTNEEKIEVLRANSNNAALLELLKFTYDPRIHFRLPQDKMPYKPCKLVDQDEHLYREVFKLVKLCEIWIEDPGMPIRKIQGGPINKVGDASMTQLQRENYFIQMLESIHPDDAVLLNQVKNKRLGMEGLTERTIRLAFPGMIHGDIEFFTKNKMQIPDELRDANKKKEK